MDANSFVVNAWYVIGTSGELPKGVLKGAKIAGVPIVMWRTQEGKVVAFDDRCVHKRMPLSAGRFIEPDVLECAYHGLCYDPAGQCVRIPSQPDGAIPSRAKLRPHPVVEQDGLVWMWTGDPAKVAGARPPRSPEIDDAAWETYTVDPIKVPANYRLLIENLIDITHFYPLHDGNIGDLANSQIPIEVTEPEVDGKPTVKQLRRAQNYQQPPFFVDWFGYPIVDRWHTHHVLGPGLTRVELRVAPPGRLGEAAPERGYILYHTHTPVDGGNLVWRWSLSTRVEHRSATKPEKTLNEHIRETFPAVVDQDRWALEKQQQMVEYPDDGYAEIFLRSDAALIKVRKMLTAMETGQGPAAIKAAAA